MYFNAVLVAFLLVVVELYYSIKENALRWLKTAKNGK